MWQKLKNALVAALIAPINYAIEALRLHGPIKGFYLAVFRVLRCNPFCKGGYDPVPLPKDKK